MTARRPSREEVQRAARMRLTAQMLVASAVLLTAACAKSSATWEREAREVGAAEMQKCSQRLQDVSSGRERTATQLCFEIYAQDSCRARGDLALWEHALISARSNGKVKIARVGLENARMAQERIEIAYKSCLAYAESSQAR